jgi:aryl-alcohol dehydrogenase-like predicted oxidoreductase
MQRAPFISSVLRWLLPLMLDLQFQFSPSTYKTVTMASKSTPQLIFGAASFGDAFREAKDAQSVLDILKSHNIKRIDTAGRYPRTNPGLSEDLLGTVKAAEQGFTIDTKILAGSGDGSGELKREKIEESVSASLRRLGVSKVYA